MTSNSQLKHKDYFIMDVSLTQGRQDMIVPSAKITTTSKGEGYAVADNIVYPALFFHLKAA